MEASATLQHYASKHLGIREGGRLEVDLSPMAFALRYSSPAQDLCNRPMRVQPPSPHKSLLQAKVTDETSLQALYRLAEEAPEDFGARDLGDCGF